MRALMTLIPLFSVTLFGQEVPKSLSQDLNKEAGLEQAFRDPGPRYAKVVLSRQSNDKIGALKAVVYSASVSGLPHDKSYVLMTWDISTEAPVPALEGVRIGNSGELLCGNAKACPHVGSALRLVMTGMLGQPRRYVLAGTDGKPVAMGETVPFPSIGTDHGCTLEVVILRPNASVALELGSGFVPGETVKIISHSRGEVNESSADANDHGIAGMVDLPFVKGFDDGQAEITFQGSKCHPSTKFNWGSYQEVRVDSADAKP